MIRLYFLRTVSYLPHVKEPVTKGHLSCRETFSRILRCPLKTEFTVLVILFNLFRQYITLSDNVKHNLTLFDIM